ncbi:lysozyme inhibitor LprI family protein [Virgibacillus sp. JSM 102003]|uniref:lysozyme inhibitor LprI family protein n=1 Tax=Virgibacillus sp. JSM 102003 TaxID=1562108 RepID=UPI0035BF72C4
MKNYRNYLIIMFTALFLILVACGNLSEESSTKSNNGSSTQHANSDLTNKDENITENTETNDQEDTSANLTASDGDSGVSETKKEEYLKKLNDMEQSDKHAEAKTTTADMEEQEKDRYEKWDKALNEIYGVLKEHLSTEQMDQLREEQRNWVEHRDIAAKEASLKYEGGSMESLEYVATQASITRERCYELVANYMM